MTELLAALIGAFAGLLAGWATARSDAGSSIRGARIWRYGELWEMTGRLPLWPKDPEFTYEDLDEMTNDLRDWYFKRPGPVDETDAIASGAESVRRGADDSSIGLTELGNGGLVMSRQSREAYGDVQEVIGAVLIGNTRGELSPEHYELVRARCSSLRTELTKDLLSRRRGELLTHR